MEYEIAFVITDPSTTEQEMQKRLEMTEGSNIIILKLLASSSVAINGYN